MCMASMVGYLDLGGQVQMVMVAFHRRNTTRCLVFFPFQVTFEDMDQDCPVLEEERPGESGVALNLTC